MPKLIRKIWLYSPTLGILLFFGLFYLAAQQYPGGSPVDPQYSGFDWQHNYWCNLMNRKAINGAMNPARAIAIGATLVLCGSMSIFFFLFAEAYAPTRFRKIIIQVCGTISMIFAVFLFSDWHDLMTILSSGFGLFAVLGMLKLIAESQHRSWQLGAMLCVILLGLNNYIYYTGQALCYLALIQKISFLCILSWIIFLNFATARRLLATSS